MDPRDPGLAPLARLDRDRDGVRAQILATEHWGLLSARSMAYTEIFSRSGMLLTIVSATVVALALIGQATDFGADFRVFSILLLPLVLLIGLTTFVRVADVSIEDVAMVAGMNRLRHAYLEIAPELEPYFVTGHTDDEAGVLKTIGHSQPIEVGGVRVIAALPVLVGLIDAVVAGFLVALVVQAIGGSDLVAVAFGFLTAVIVAVLLARSFVARIEKIRRDRDAPRFPSDE
jgi:hypothetical protein